MISGRQKLRRVAMTGTFRSGRQETCQKVSAAMDSAEFVVDFIDSNRSGGSPCSLPECSKSLKPV